MSLEKHLICHKYLYTKNDMSKRIKEKGNNVLNFTNNKIYCLLHLFRLCPINWYLESKKGKITTFL